MKKTFLVLLLVGLAGLGALLGSFLAARHLCHQPTDNDDLAWLRSEFKLGAADMARVRALHEGYLPQCEAMCAQIAAEQRTLQNLLGTTNQLTPAAEKKLAEIATLRAQCQANMLRHFEAVSRAMPPEPGRRYLEEMRRATLGLQHTMEQSLTPPATPRHEHP
jgi:small-conductance mechanosensitive channel